jgi:hypothetical protein
MPDTSPGQKLKLLGDFGGGGGDGAAGVSVG